MNKYLLLALSISALAGCNLINPEEPLPTYVKIDGIEVLDRQGTPLTSKVRGVALSLGRSDKIEALGVFMIPNIVPVLIEEPGELFVIPSIESDATVSQIYAYPFYKNITLDISPAPGDTLDLGTLQTRLIDTFTRHLDEDFEGGSTFEITGPDSACTYAVQTDEVSTGLYAGLTTLSAPQGEALLISNTAMSLTHTEQTYIELDYKSNADFGVSLVYQDPATSTFQEYSLLGLRAKDDWNTVYVKLSDKIGYINASTYYLAFKVVRDEQASTPTRLYLDNVRVNALK